MIFIATLTFLSCLVLSAINNHAQIRLRDKESMRDQNIWHTTSALIRGIITFTFAYLIEDEMMDIITVWILVQLCWWILFDSILSFLRGRPIFYVGHTDIIDIAIRKIAIKIRLKPELVGVSLKLLLITITLIIHNS